MQRIKDGAAAAGNSPVHGGTGPRTLNRLTATSSTPRLASCHPDRSSRRDPRVAVRVTQIKGRLSRLRSAQKTCGSPLGSVRAGQTAESRQSRATPVDRMSRERGRTHGGGNAKLGRIEAQAGTAPAVSSVAETEPRSPGWAQKTGLYPGEPETCRRSLRLFVRNFVYLALLLAVFKVYRIEERAFQGRAFQMLVTLALAALPVALSRPLPLEEARLRGGLGRGLVLDLRHPGHRGRARRAARSSSGICFLPIPWIGRAAAVVAVAVAVACTRTGLPRTVIPDNVLPIVASMFMFRMIIYLYELKHAKKRETLVDTLSYFFLLPNFCFMHFPVVDYRTMQRGYFADDVHALQRRGLQMMLRGTVHLLIYRLVYHEMLIPAVEGARPGQSLLLPGLQLPALSPGFGPVSHCLRHAPPVRLPASRDAPQLPAGDGVHRLLAADQHLLERLHGPAFLQSGRVPAQAVAAAGGAGGGHRGRFSGDLVLACLPVVLAARELGFLGSRRPLLGDLGGAGAGECPARRPPEPNRGARAYGRGARTGRRSASWRPVPLKIAATFTTIAVLWSLWSSPSLSAWLDMVSRGFHGS